MPKFRKKPVVIEAEQWFPGREIEGVVCNPLNHPLMSDAHYVKTVNGWAHIEPGEWIITGVKGEFYPCKPDIFEATYEPARDEDAALLRAARSDRAVLDEVNDKVDILLKMARLV